MPRPFSLSPHTTTIGIVCPASPPKQLDRLEAGIAYLRTLGFRIKRSRTSYGTHAYLSGSDAERVAEFNAFLKDPDIQALFCVRGGYGTLRILPHIDYAAARDFPKLLVGYSDITALQLALLAQSRLTSISGPMVDTDWSAVDPESERLFLELAQGATPSPLTGPHHAPLSPLQPGYGEGLLIGGNLYVLTRLIGTPFLPTLENAILFIEDIGEPPYRVDGMLAHLKLAGIWDSLAGLVIGDFSMSSDSSEEEMKGVFEDYCRSAPFPVAMGLRYGHIPCKNAMPIGVQARLIVSDREATLAMLEPVVTRPPQSYPTL